MSKKTYSLVALAETDRRNADGNHPIEVWWYILDAVRNYEDCEVHRDPKW